jgi:hypothetical protein
MQGVGLFPDRPDIASAIPRGLEEKVAPVRGPVSVRCSCGSVPARQQRMKITAIDGDLPSPILRIPLTSQSRWSPFLEEPRGDSTRTLSLLRIGRRGNSTASGRWRSKLSPNGSRDDNTLNSLSKSAPNCWSLVLAWAIKSVSRDKGSSFFPAGAQEIDQKLFSLSIVPLRGELLQEEKRERDLIAIRRNIANGLHAHLFQFLDRACVDV